MKAARGSRTKVIARSIPSYRLLFFPQLNTWDGRDLINEPRETSHLYVETRRAGHAPAKGYFYSAEVYSRAPARRFKETLTYHCFTVSRLRHNDRPAGGAISLRFCLQQQRDTERYVRVAQLPGPLSTRHGMPLLLQRPAERAGPSSLPLLRRRGCAAVSTNFPKTHFESSKTPLNAEIFINVINAVTINYSFRWLSISGDVLKAADN